MINDPGKHEVKDELFVANRREPRDEDAAEEMTSFTRTGIYGRWRRVGIEMAELP